MAESFDLPSVDTVTVGTVGPPGKRVFYLQARAGTATVTLKLEKQQVAALVAALQEVLAELPTEPADRPSPELQSPVEAAWPAGGIGLSGYDSATRRVTLVLEELRMEEGDGDDEPAASARLGLTVGQMVALVTRGIAMVAGGRPDCPICGKPMDPEGHACVKTNGHLKR